MYKINFDLKEPLLLPVQSISDDRGLLVPFTDNVDHFMAHSCYQRITAKS